VTAERRPHWRDGVGGGARMPEILSGVPPEFQANEPNFGPRFRVPITDVLGYPGGRGVPVPGRRVEGAQPSTSKAGPDDAPVAACWPCYIPGGSS
jgi:hypothetical protein